MRPFDRIIPSTPPHEVSSYVFCLCFFIISPHKDSWSLHATALALATSAAAFVAGTCLALYSDYNWSWYSQATACLAVSIFNLLGWTLFVLSACCRMVPCCLFTVSILGGGAAGAAILFTRYIRNNELGQELYCDNFEYSSCDDYSGYHIPKGERQFKCQGDRQMYTALLATGTALWIPASALFALLAHSVARKHYSNTMTPAATATATATTTHVVAAIPSNNDNNDDDHLIVEATAQVVVIDGDTEHGGERHQGSSTILVPSAPSASQNNSTIANAQQIVADTGVVVPIDPGNVQVVEQDVVVEHQQVSIRASGATAAGASHHVELVVPAAAVENSPQHRRTDVANQGVGTRIRWF